MAGTVSILSLRFEPAASPLGQALTGAKEGETVLLRLVEANFNPVAARNGTERGG